MDFFLFLVLKIKSTGSGALFDLRESRPETEERPFEHFRYGSLRPKVALRTIDTPHSLASLKYSTHFVPYL